MKIRKLTALLLTLCMIFSLSVAAFAAEPEAHTIYDSAPDEEATVSAETTTSGTIPGSKIKWELNEHNWLTISGSGDCEPFTSKDDQPWAAVRDQITQVWFDDMDALHIADLAYWFEDCVHLTTAEIPSTTPTIGKHAFYNCPKLSTLTIYYGEDILESIGEEAFWRENDSGDTLYIGYIIGYPKSSVPFYDYDWAGSNRNNKYFYDLYGIYSDTPAAVGIMSAPGISVTSTGSIIGNCPSCGKYSFQGTYVEVAHSSRGHANYNECNSCHYVQYLGTYTTKSHGSGAYGSGTCPDCGSHTWVLQSQQAATCTSNGYRSYSCACGQTKSETIYASGHSYSYPMWYNGHGIDIGRLHRGYWLPVKPGWYYGCGEYGAEGLDSAEVMEECYPREWMREPFDPGRIVRSQTKSFSGFFYDTQEDMQGWISRSQRYQAFAARMMTEAFRRDDRMVSNAIHLFIDAWPSGWMKSIMDCKRIPKQAYFAYRDALAPLLVSLRTDRFAYTAGETIQIEAFLCNDTVKSGAYTLAFELYNEQNKLIQTGRVPAHADACRAAYIASAEFPAETAQDRETLTLRAVLLDGNGDVVNDTEQKLTVFQDVTVVPNDNVVILKLEPGLHTVAGETVTVKPCGMLPLHFVSRKTGHPAVDEFKEQDFSYWYDAKEDCITPLLDTTFTVEGFTPILLSNNMDEQGNWGPVLAAAEKLYEGKHYVICQLDLRQENPVAKRFLRNLYRLGTK